MSQTLQSRIDRILRDPHGGLYQLLQAETWAGLQVKLQKYDISHQESQANRAYILERIGGMVRGDGVSNDLERNLEGADTISQGQHGFISHDDFDTESTFAPSTVGVIDQSETASLCPTDNISLNSRSGLVQAIRCHSAVARDDTKSGESYTPNNTETIAQKRRATIDYLGELRAARRPRQKPDKTKGRKLFEGFCEVVDFVVPIDVSREKTSMKQSALGHLFVNERRLVERGKSGV